MRNTGFWIQLLGALQRGDLPLSFGMARPSFTTALWRRHFGKPEQPLSAAAAASAAAGAAFTEIWCSAQSSSCLQQALQRQMPMVSQQTAH